MKEENVSFKTAKLAKEKGFNWECLYFYCKNLTCDYLDKPYEYSFEVNANIETVINGEIDNFGCGKTWSAPTQALLQRWLREVHNIQVYVFGESIIKETGTTSYKYIIGILPNKQESIAYLNDELGQDGDLLIEPYTVNEDWYLADYKTYEEALEVGLQEGLKLIKDGSNR